MSRLAVSLGYRTLRATGDTVLWADLVLSLKTNRDVWKEVPFRVDPGTEMTTMPASEAGKLDLPIPRHTVVGVKLNGQAVRSGLLRARVAGLDPTEFIFPCYVLGDPNLAPPARARNLLGLTGVINQIRLSFDGTISAPAPWGVLVVEKR